MRSRSAAGWVGALACALATPAAADPICQPAAAIEGEPALVGSVTSELVSLGVASHETAGCPVVRAHVATAGSRVAVAVDEPGGRHEQEVVTDAHIAAAWIESWAMSDLGAPLLAATAAPAIAPPSTSVVVRATAPGPSGPRLALTVGGELGAASDASAWDGASASACLVRGSFCFGARARLDHDAHFSGNGGLSFADRWDAGLFALAAARLALGRVTVVPSVALGLGYLHAARAEPSAAPPMNGCMIDPTGGCKPPYYVGDGFSVQRLGPRAELGLDLALPVAGGVSLVLGGALTVAPLATSAPAIPAGLDSSGTMNCDPMTDPNCLPMPPPPYPIEAYQLPADPNQTLRLGVGLEWDL